MPAPTEARALAALQKVQSLPGKELDAFIGAEIGNPMLGVMKSLATAMLPALDPEQQNRVVHLMVLGYALRREVEK
ncbi:MAG: hypothetical protein ACYC8T_37885 [Myxococcaceae bacterium]